MHLRAKWLGFTAVLAIAACGGQPGELTIRSTGKPMLAEVKPGSSRVADGRLQFALGNVALALETFRRAGREDPGDIDAIIGVAACYDRMGRFDLSRKHYETALAAEPGNPNTLAAFAASLNLQGRANEEVGVRREILQRLDPMSKTATRKSVEPSAPIQSHRSLAAAGTIALDDDRQLDTWPAAPASIEMRSQLEPTQMAISSVGTTPGLAVVRTPSVLPTAPARSVTIRLPPPRPAPLPVVKQATAGATARDQQPTATVRPRIKINIAPRLERTSMGEVALITRRAEPNRNPAALQAQFSTVRFVLLRDAEGSVPVRVLNAARIDRLAARTRSLMSSRGWKNIVIGNAAGVRARSIVLYPANVRLAALRLAAQFGFYSAPRAGKGEVTILLGSDAAAAVRRHTAN